MNARNKDSCHQLFKNLKIVPLKSQYIFPFYDLLPKIEIYMNQTQKFITSTPDLFFDLYTPTANLTTFQKGPFHFGIKVFKHLPTSMKNTSPDIHKFRSVLKCFPLTNSFYLEEYFTWNSNKDLGSV
jgi:hypothetical protein